MMLKTHTSGSTLNTLFTSVLRMQNAVNVVIVAAIVIVVAVVAV